MPLTYVIPDLHGRFDLLCMAMLKIDEHALMPGTLVFLGDYVDRGPESCQVIKSLRGLQERRGRTKDVICLKGNHEQMMLDTCHGVIPSAEWWLENGGGRTLMSYGHPATGPLDLGYVLKSHLDWIDILPVIYVDKHRVYVHAGVKRGVPLDQQHLLMSDFAIGHQEMLWMYYDESDESGYGDYHVVHGHRQHKNGPLLQKGRTNLDTYAWMTGRLVVGVFDDDRPGGPVDVLEVRGPGSRDATPSHAEQEAEAAARG